MLIPFGSVDADNGRLAVREAHELRGWSAGGPSSTPNIQAFWPNDHTFFPLYELIAEGLIARFHAGTTGIGAGMPGGGGVRFNYSNPDGRRRCGGPVLWAGHHSQGRDIYAGLFAA